MTTSTTTASNTQQEMLAWLDYGNIMLIDSHPDAIPKTPQRSLEIQEAAMLSSYFKIRPESIENKTTPQIDWGQTGTLAFSSPTKLTNLAIIQLGSAFTIPQFEPVLAYLAQHQYLVSALSAAAWKIQEYLSPSRLKLELLCDPEDGLSQLMLYIFPKEVNAQLRSQLKRFDQEWWLQQPFEVRHNLCIDLAYEV